MSHPKAVEPIGIHLDDFDEEQLRREVGMMQLEQTPNELVELELEAIDQLAKSGEYK